MKRVWWALLVFTTGTNLATPLFPLYQERFGMGTATIALLFATYAAFLLPSLLLVGPLSDRVGRKTLVLPSLGLMLVGSLLFAFAPGASLLFVARALQGLATGGFLGACTAFLADRAGEDGKQKALLLASFTTMVGFGLGPGLAGVLAQYAGGDPIATPFLTHAALLVTAFLAAVSVPETVAEKKPANLDPSVGVPEGSRRPFLGFVAPAGFIFFALNGTVIALVPQFALQVLGLGNLAVAGGSLFLLMLAGGLAQVAARRADLLRVTRWGLVLTAAGAFAIIGAAHAPDAFAPLVLLFGVVVEGVGNGWTFKGSLALAGEIAPPGGRARVISGYYVAAYTGFSLPVLCVGILSEYLGLTTALLSLAAVLTIGAAAILAASRFAMKIT
jgi:MFS family permease